MLIPTFVRFIAVIALVAGTTCWAGNNSSQPDSPDAQREAGSVQAKFPDPTVNCQNELATDPKFAGLVKKLPLTDIRQISVAMLANDAIPTPRERRLIGQWFDGEDTCIALGNDYHQSHYPAEIINLANGVSSRLKAIGVDLYKGKISFGDANKQIVPLRDEYLANLQLVVQKYKREIEAKQEVEAKEKQEAEAKEQLAASQARQAADAERQHQYADLQRQQAAQETEAEAQRLRRQQMILNYLQSTRPPPLQLPQLPSINSGITTNCLQNGNQTNCYSR